MVILAQRDIGTLRTRLSWEDDGANRSLEGFRRDLKGLRSEMNLAKSGGKDYTNSLKGMRQQSDILTRRFQTQEQRVRELRKRYDESVKVKGEDAAATKDLQAQLNNAVAEMNKMEGQLERINEEIRRMESPWTRLGEGMTKTGETLQTVGRGMTDFGKNYTMRVTAPIVAGGVALFKASMDYESAFAGVRKTVDLSEEGYAKLSKGIREMAKELPASASEIASVAEAAGQLGIENDSILSFTRTIIDLGESTNLSLEQASSEFARFANIVGMSQEDFDRLGSSVVGLGNTMATTESEIMSMAMRLAAQGSQVGMTEAQIVALSATMSSLGIEAEAGGTAMTMVLKKIDGAVGESGKELGKFAKASGVSSSEFAKAWNDDPIKALDLFINGLSDSSDEGANLTSILSDLGIKGIRESDTILRMAGASDLLSDAVNTSSKAWKENSALTDEAAQRYATTESQIKMMWNRIKDVAISLGDALVPAVMDALDAAEPLILKIEEGAQAFSEMDEEQQRNILKLIAFAAAIGPVSVGLGGLTTTIGGVLKIGGSFASMLGKAGGKGLLGRIAGLSLGGPVGLAIAGITTLGGIFLATRDDGEKLHDINLEVAESLKDTHTEVSEAAARYEELRNKANLTTEEFGQLLDIRKEMASNPEEDALKELQSRYDELREKSGLTNEQLDELITHNQTIVDNAPHTAEAHSKQGEAIAGVNEELKDYLESLRQTSLENLELEKMKWAKNAEKHQKDLNEAKKEEKAIDEAIAKINEYKNMSIDDLQAKYWEIADAQSSYLTSEEDSLRMGYEKEFIESLLNDELIEGIEHLQEQKSEQAGIIENAEIELAKGQEIDALHAEILLKKLGINATAEEGIGLAEKQLESLRGEKEELEKILKKQGDYNGETSEQIRLVDEKIRAHEETLGLLGKETDYSSKLIDKEQRREAQIRHVNDVLSAQAGQLDRNNGKIDTGTGKARKQNEVLRESILKHIETKTNTDQTYRSLGSMITKTIKLNVSGAGALAGVTAGIRGYATGTDHHPGGAFIAGEEGYELGRMGNRWEMLNLGMYNRPRGYEVFTHDESKKIISALNRMPGYATGARPTGEADRVVSQLNNTELGSNQPVVIEVHVTSEMDSKAVGKGVARVVTDIQNRNNFRRRRMPRA